MFSNQSKVAIHCRFLLYRDEVFRIPQAGHSVQVLSGIAWLTVAGEDIILTSNETVSLLPYQDVALVSALSDKPLILEVQYQKGRDK